MTHKARCRIRAWRSEFDPTPGLVQGIILKHELLARWIVNKHWLDLVVLGEIPFRFDVLNLAADAEAVDFAIGGENPDRHRDVIAAALAVNNALEKEALALGFRDAAAELPAHERMHLGIFVDRALHPDQQPLLLQGSDMCVEIWIIRNGHAPPLPSCARLRISGPAPERRFHPGKLDSSGSANQPLPP